ncbi:MAG: T9SS type A sorting domain-containing protein [Phaeodactylibacter sp.]|nr:T9SS type A sorting domain-containing protein [Phaeodactylibacter sp.]
MKQALLLLSFTLFTIHLTAQNQFCDDCPATPGAHSGNYQYLSDELEQPTVFPNPAIDFISLKNPGTVQTIRIYNLVGRELRQFEVEMGKRYPVSDLPRGMYLVQMVDQSQNVIKTQRINKR